MPSSYIVGMMGARMSYAVPEIMHNRAMLSKFFTDITSGQDWPAVVNYMPDWLLPDSARRLKTRLPTSLPKSMIKSFPFFGLEYTIRLSKCRSVRERSNTFIWAGKEFCKRINHEPWDKADAIYMFNSAALEAFIYAKTRNMHKVLEQTIAPVEFEENIMKTESEAFPEWEDIDMGFPPELKERQHMEWELADCIVCGSNFVKQCITVCGGPTDRCKVIPYGVKRPAEARIRSEASGKIRILYAGTICLRKGVQYIAAAAEKLKDIAEFRLVGKPLLTDKGMRMISKDSFVVGHIQRNLMHKEFMNADILVFPSLCEGSATVTYEALCRGLPVICTNNAGSQVRNGIDGLIIQERSADAICEAALMLHKDKDLIPSFSKNAIEGSNRLTLEAYSKSLTESLK